MASRSFSHLSFASFPYHFNTAAYLRFCLVISSLVVATINCFFCSVSCASRLCAAMVVYCSQQTNLKYVLLSYVLFDPSIILSSLLFPFFIIIFCIFSTAQNHDIVFSDITYSERRHNEEELFKKLYTIATFLFIDIKKIWLCTVILLCGFCFICNNAFTNFMSLLDNHVNIQYC